MLSCLVLSAKFAVSEVPASEKQSAQAKLGQTEGGRGGKRERRLLVFTWNVKKDFILFLFSSLDNSTFLYFICYEGRLKWEASCVCSVRRKKTIIWEEQLMEAR